MREAQWPLATGNVMVETGSGLVFLFAGVFAARAFLARASWETEEDRRGRPMRGAAFFAVQYQPRRRNA